MLATLKELLEDLRYGIVGEIHEPPRAERRVPLPADWRDHPVAALAKEVAGSDGGLWTHQVEALARFGQGENVVLATATASGKSLVFVMAAVRTVLDDPDARIAVFYPLKALSQDQEEKWRGALRSLTLPETWFGRIDGSVPSAQRDSVLESARILLLTPDIVHHWMLRNAATRAVRTFVEDLALVVLDEAHVYDAVFGTNAAFLFRRLLALHALLDGRRRRPVRFVAASATMADAAEHMRRLTGRTFCLIDEAHNGAPHAGRDLLHVNFPPIGGTAYAELGKLLSRIVEAMPELLFIAFADSRQGVERVVLPTEREDILPYRAGLEEDDRHRILSALQQGRLRGVVSTSALELGIDIPALELGFTLGVPWSRRAFHQRVGRVGRRSRGVFLVLAPADQFHRMGTTFEKYCRSAVEPTHIYLGNRFVQYCHARCLVREVEDFGGRTLPEADWPDGFVQVYHYALPGAGRPRDFDHIHQIGGDEPHLNYGLRTSVEPQLRIREHQTDDSLGSVDRMQAVREVYPGACYLYLGRPYQVDSWRSAMGHGEIRVVKMKRPVPTQPILEIYVNLDLLDGAGNGILNGHVRASDRGFLAEVHLQVVERVVGYRIGKERYYYKDMADERPQYRAKTRDFRTTGVVFMIEDKWFDRNVKDSLKETLGEIAPQIFGISPVDISWTGSRIALLKHGKPHSLRQTLAVYDIFVGGLRLTESIYARFEELLKALQEAKWPWTEQLRRWFDSLVPGERGVLDVRGHEPGEGWIRVLAPGSRAFFRKQSGELQDVVVRRPCLIDLPEYGIAGEIGYEIEAPEGTRREVVAKAIETAEEGWEMVDWNPRTDEIRPLEED